MPALFDEIGTLVRDNPGMPAGIWFLVYERPGAPALTAALEFSGGTVCAVRGRPLLCGSLQPGTRGHLLGLDLGSAIRVVSLEIEE